MTEIIKYSKLASGETRKVSSLRIATIGMCQIRIKKILKLVRLEEIDGEKKTTNKRRCDESADHPHGGGEGKTSGGRSPVSPWGQSAKGLKTRRPKRSDKLT